ncbi:RNA polymerase sigma factor [Candidatus Nitrospira allomarina]|uniref:Sigma-70 family RNA polymerase sigma factor n=1 Tax=Candidatus Nitrospira allomarina TaxID=3020900 RepID=A0AA96JWL4_9BACT|nr:sigma-70 family RNA polymerase sigma factor [Candidatus Nitrospira allomarina]WNM58036.1 sigma-70 family RNA polymerase sigma factor [Candidatus Nitrospira allomarina]
MSTITAESMDGLFSAQAPGRLRKPATPALRVFEGHDRHECQAKDNPAEAALVKRVRRGDETAFKELVERYHSPLRRVAMTFVNSEAVAEEVVQDTWMALLKGIHRFEGRSSLKTWIFRILVNRAKTQGVRESRYVEFPGKASGSEKGETDQLEDPTAMLGGEGWPGAYSGIISSQGEVSPERQLLNKEMVRRIYTVIQTLPAMQRQVIQLRDVEGVESEDVCRMLSLSESNQRVLLHRARTKVRQALEPWMESSAPGPPHDPTLTHCA